MSQLTINGIEVPISKESWSDTLVEVGDRGRSVSGKALTTYVRRYRKRTGTAIVTDAEQAEALRGLIAGSGIGWSFDTDLFSDGTGLGAVTTGTTPTIVASDGGVSPQFGAGFLKCPAGSTATWTHGLGTSWSACVWSYTSGAWHHYGKRSDAGGYWLDGIYTGSSTSIFNPSTTVFEVQGDSGATRYFDDAIYLPFLAPPSWFAAIYGYGAAWPKPPQLVGGGTLIAYGSTTLRGQCEKSEYTSRGSLAHLQRLAITLEED